MMTAIVLLFIINLIPGCVYCLISMEKNLRKSYKDMNEISVVLLCFIPNILLFVFAPLKYCVIYIFYFLAVLFSAISSISNAYQSFLGGLNFPYNFLV
jgi:hypothetical protein